MPYLNIFSADVFGAQQTLRFGAKLLFTNFFFQILPPFFESEHVFFRKPDPFLFAESGGSIQSEQ